MIMQDKLEKERNDAKNAVEEYVYEMRDKLSGEYEKFVSEDVSMCLPTRCLLGAALNMVGTFAGIHRYTVKWLKMGSSGEKFCISFGFPKVLSSCIIFFLFFFMHHFLIHLHAVIYLVFFFKSAHPSLMFLYFHSLFKKIEV